MKPRTKISLVATFFLLVAFNRAEAQISYGVTDLGTLGGATSTANGITAQGTNASGMIVGSSTTNDNSEHAFLYVNGQMFDLNTMCDLSTSDFRVLTVAKTINDSCLIVGEGITTNGDKHAFLFTPLSVDGGQWSYVCCQWVWIQQGGGWWWEENCGCYKWHGPPGRRPPCPPRPPHCWWFPLPCRPPCQRPTPTPGWPTPTPGRPTPTPGWNPTPTPTLPPPGRRTPTPPVHEQTPTPGVPIGVLPSPTPTHTGITVGVEPTPTPTLPPAVHTTATPRRGRGGPTFNQPASHINPTGTKKQPRATPTPHGRSKPTPTPTRLRKTKPTPTPS